jgi:hypothetical protein
MSPYWVANIAFLASPIVAILLFSKFSAVKATVWTVLGGFLLLPADVVIKFPMLPQLDKNTIPTLCALVGCLALGGDRFRLWSRFGLVEALMIIYLLVPIVTSSLNGDTIVIGSTVLPGVGLYDAGSTVISQAIILVSFVLGRQLIRTSGDLVEVFRTMIVGALFYSIPMLIELRLSPQMSNWVYGLTSSGFLNEMRYGGYRPVVFMNNGLMLAFFITTAILAATLLWRTGVRIGKWSSGVVASYLGVILFWCKSAGALLYGIALVPIIIFTKPKAQARVAVALVVIALAYPLLKMNGLFPDQTIIDMAGALNEERAQSLSTRFEQEAFLLDHSSQRLWFGWGRFGRNRVYDAYGKDTTITDGMWIITFSTFGLIGFLAEFGLLALPVFKAARVLPMETSPAGRALLSAMMLIAAASLVEQLPNASLTSWMWFLVGGLDGRCEHLRLSLTRRAGERADGRMAVSAR